MFTHITKIGFAAAITLFAGNVSAATIDFDNPLAPPAAGSDYTVGDYFVEDVNRNSGNCFSGFCTHESGQGTQITITRTDDGIFDFDGFWFSSQGRGSTGGNNLIVTAFTGGPGSYVKGDSIEFFFDKLFTDLASEGATVTHVKGEAPQPGGPGNYVNDCKLVNLCDQYGYSVVLGSAFDDVTKIEFSSATTANNRIDNIALDGSVPPVPLPAGIPLALTALGALGLLGYRKKKTW